MVKKYVNRSDFARLAGVSASAVTKACSSTLKAALNGKRIDMNHVDAIAYLKDKARGKIPEPAQGVDPLYDNAVIFCQNSNRYSASNIQRGLNIGYARAKRIFSIMQAAGIIEDGKIQVNLKSDSDPAIIVDHDINEELKIKKPHVRGTAAAKDKKKSESLEQLKESEQSGVDFDVPDDIRELGHYTLNDLIAKFGTDQAFIDWLKATKMIEDIYEKRLKNAEKSGQLISRSVVSEGLVSTIDGAFTRMLTDGAKTIAVRTHTLVTTGADVAEVEDFISKQLSTFIRPTKSKIKRVLKNA